MVLERFCCTSLAIVRRLRASAEARIRLGVFRHDMLGPRSFAEIEDWCSIDHEDHYEDKNGNRLAKLVIAR